MKNAGMNKILPVAAVLLMAILSSCNSGYKKADLTVIDFPGFDSTKFDPLDKPSGKLFDILTNNTTGLDFSNDAVNIFRSMHAGRQIRELHGQVMRLIQKGGTEPEREDINWVMVIFLQGVKQKPIDQEHFRAWSRRNRFTPHTDEPAPLRTRKA